MKTIQQERKTLFHRDDVPPLTNQSQTRAVCLQFIARVLLALKVTDATKVLRHGHIDQSAFVCGVFEH